MPLVVFSQESINMQVIVIKRLTHDPFELKPEMFVDPLGLMVLPPQ